MQSEKLSYSLLLECVQHDYDIKKINTLIKSIKNWEYFYNRASMHGVLPLVYRVFCDKHVNIDEKIRLHFRVEIYDIARDGMIKSVELVKIITLFRGADIDAVAFKGPTLSAILYDDVISRQYSDLDILVDEASLYRAGKLLLESGFKPTIPITFLKNRTYLNVGKDIAFDNHALGLHVELHWKLFEKRLIVKKSSFFSQYQKVKIHNHTLKTLDTEALLLYLCMHGSKHFWERLEWIVDVDRLIRKHPKIDWDKILTEAKMMHSTKLLYFGLQVVHLLFKTPIALDIYGRMNDRGLALKVKEKLFGDNLNIHVDAPVNFESIENLALITDGRYGSFRTKLRAYLQLKEGDVLLVNLPYTFSWVYYILRPFRLAWKFMYRP